MMGVGGASAAYSRPTSTKRQSHKRGTQTKDVETTGIKVGCRMLILL